MASGDSGNGICLNWGGELIATERNVLQHNRMEASALELRKGQREKRESR